ncbi:hypothetical protein BJF82_12495 [Kytococcus sp. CUA-901]|nr:hypothetical protein BJF82_12495 [Kytococcus sp. CUA-901]
MSKIMMAAAFGAGYVLGARQAGNGMSRSAPRRRSCGPPTVARQQADKAKQQAGKVTEQAKGRLSNAQDGDQDSTDDPWEVDTDTALAGDDQESPRG